ncbi:MAG TPA: hypothetical protein VK849_15455 [Longimicrobiales bacterium]|nr:hypothetical protein [Longimicrobiales bacterium]
MASPRSGDAPAASFAADFAAGVAAGLVGLVTFGVFHTIWILNVPFVFLEGLLHVAVFGAALAWAVRSVRAARPFADPWRSGLALGAALWATVVPYEIAGVAWGPWPAVSGFADALPFLWLTFLGAPVGAAIGWWRAGRALPALACAVAAVALNVFLGGSIAFFGGRGVVLILFVLLLPACLLAGIAYMGVWRRLTGRARAPVSALPVG